MTTTRFKLLAAAVLITTGLGLGVGGWYSAATTQPFSAPDITFEVNIDRGAGVQTVSFSPDGRTLATGHQDGSISLWAVPQTEAVKPVKGDVSSC